MGKTRICGKRCHDAKHATCRCWCGGTFHGAEGVQAREAFAATFQVAKLPTTQMLFDVLTEPRLFDSLDGGVPRVEWRQRVEAGVAAQAQERAARKRRKAS